MDREDKLEHGEQDDEQNDRTIVFSYDHQAIKVEFKNGEKVVHAEYLGDKDYEMIISQWIYFGDLELEW